MIHMGHNCSQQAQIRGLVLHLLREIPRHRNLVLKLPRRISPGRIRQGLGYQIAKHLKNHVAPRPTQIQCLLNVLHRRRRVGAV